jgi:hypothetical protein
VKATRTIPARPVNDGNSVAQKIIDLVGATLDRSPHLDATTIRTELERATPVLALLASGGHLRRGQLVLTAPGLRLRIDVPVGEDALKAGENLDPPRGAGSADDWTLHVPVPDSLAGIARAAARACAHLSVEAAPDDEPEVQSQSLAAAIDLSRLTDGARGA